MKAYGLAAVVAMAVAFCATAGERPILQPDCRVNAAGVRSVGLRVDLMGLASLKRPTKTVYRETAVALWRPGYGEQIAAVGADAVADVNAAVKAEEVPVPKTTLEAAVDHVKRNAGKYIASAAVAAVGGAGWAIYDHNKDDGAPAQAAGGTSTASADNRLQNSPALGAITTGDNSPVNISITITAMPPE